MNVLLQKHKSKFQALELDWEQNIVEFWTNVTPIPSQT